MQFVGAGLRHRIRIKQIVIAHCEYHVPVMLDQCLDGLNISEGKVFLDCTLGGGSHTMGILERGGKVISIDQDPDAITHSSIKLKQFIDCGRCEIVQSNFRHAFDVVQKSCLAGLNSIHNGKVNGVLMDLGISSFQIDEPTRGFAHSKSGALDMRMNKGMLANGRAGIGMTAMDIINNFEQIQLANIIYEYGEEGRARVIAREIAAMRPIYTTEQLAKAIGNAVSSKDKIKVMSRCFQAFRIVVNDELGALDEALANMHKCVETNGRFVVMSYHSLEDRRVKHLFRMGMFDSAPPTPTTKAKFSKWSIGTTTPKVQVGSDTTGNPWKRITNRSVAPDKAEIEGNSRARSAKLRIAERI